MGVGKFFTGVYYGKYDKAVHFFASAGVTVVLLPVLPLWAAATAAFLVGLGKEAVDWRLRHSRIDPFDLAVNFLGIAAVTGIALAVGLSWG
ncbi:MAG: hypothetical protein Q7S23_03905 [bacterium]|nr:hypothetical protein [bacterium]